MDCCRKRFGVVRKNAEIVGLRAEAAKEACQQIAIGIVQRRRRQSVAGLNDLIARRKKRHPNTSPHVQPIKAEGGRERQ
jgi:hypothetical protein